MPRDWFDLSGEFSLSFSVIQGYHIQVRSWLVSMNRRRPPISGALQRRTLLLPWSFPGHFLPQTGHLYACRLLTFASTYTLTTPSEDVSILMLLKTAVLTRRSFLNRLLSVAIVLSFCVCLVTYHFRLNIWLFSILTFYPQILRFYPQLSLKP